ncbi:TerD family protein [Glaesserella parasuis]|uniref:TerD family protein n=1 Tax=Glaesserella parasuis TaxID=738 RepID=UPI0003ABD66F|nr:TerD family protein [Glaesserella parasuis]EQA01186.1 bacterial stress family protein [Glaesserella parasuis SW114]ATW43862.1 chemical-damaging agent resistance protein C [Glaesserella parasuis D74]EQA11752.1 bacterial stress family protein [Glaesserella parasuis D74]MCT8558079.1 TerD family protein [Glaesserella parasuis]MCT8782590.1 TerD family protein [Glaesserella parasuis]
MAISLTKGQNISLSKTDPSLKNVLVGLGWDARSTDGQDFDLDSSIFMATENGKVPSDSHFIFYNQLRSPCGGVEHTGDNLTGDGDGDDESVIVKLDQVQSDIKSLFITVTIHEAEARRQNFGQVSNAFVRLVNNDTNEEVVRFDLSEDYSTETAMVFGEIYRHNGEWKFRAIGQGYSGGLFALCKQYGVNVG